MTPSPAITSTSQLFLNLFDITNDLIILDDGSATMVLTVSAMNFGLLSEDEQDATIYAYAGLLNSLSFPTQIVIRSQPKDVSVYLKVISDKERETTNPLYKKRIKSYREFVESLVQEQNVLDKKFYFVIPLSAVEMGMTPTSVMPGAKAKPITSYDKSFIIDKAKTNLEPRRDHLIDQLARIGLYSRQLTTQELIQMLYSSYNPESFEGQKITDTQNYTTPLVQAQLQTTPEPEPVPVQNSSQPTVQPKLVDQASFTAPPSPEPQPDSASVVQAPSEPQFGSEPPATLQPSSDLQSSSDDRQSSPVATNPSPLENSPTTNSPSPMMKESENTTAPFSQNQSANQLTNPPTTLPPLPPLPDTPPQPLPTLDEQAQINQSVEQANVLAKDVHVDPSLLQPSPPTEGATS